MRKNLIPDGDVRDIVAGGGHFVVSRNGIIREFEVGVYVRFADNQLGVTGVIRNAVGEIEDVVAYRPNYVTGRLEPSRGHYVAEGGSQ